MLAMMQGGKVMLSNEMSVLGDKGFLSGICSLFVLNFNLVLAGFFVDYILATAN